MRNIFIDGDRFSLDNWYWRLSPHAKLLSDFLDANCDRAGFYAWNADLASQLTKLTVAEATASLNEILAHRDIDGPRVFMKKGLIYLHHRINVTDPNGLTINTNAHIGIIRRLIVKMPDFPECIDHLPGDFTAMSKEAKAREAKLASAGQKTRALQALIKIIEAVSSQNGGDPRRLADAQHEMEFLDNVPPQIANSLRLLQEVPNYPYHDATDKKFLLGLMIEFGVDGFEGKVRGRIARWIDEPITKKNRPHSQLRNWFKLAIKFAKEDEERDRTRAGWHRGKVMDEGHEKRVRESRSKRSAERAKAEKEREDQERKQIIEDRDWMDAHHEKKDIEVVMEKLDCDRGMAIYNMNLVRKRRKKRPLAGAVDPLGRK